MINDRMITISCGSSRWAKVWQENTLLVSELYTKLSTPDRSAETTEVYLAMPKRQQDDLKDVGGFVGGTLNGPRRKASAVRGRDIVTLDLDSIPAGGTEAVLRRIAALGCGYCAYSTRKHQPSAPRLRVLLPLDRTVQPDEYEAIARKAAELIGIDMADPSTFEPSRLMYWPSCCKDGEYIYHWEDKPLLSAAGTLDLYADWHDVSGWPQVPGAEKIPHRLAAKQQDPEIKTGIVGAFCRTYDVPGAMEAFLPDVYESAGEGRYTYTGGSTTGGAVLYDDGKYLYSHHATDPCGGMLVNAFDLVRLHKFGGMDDAADPKTPVNRLPSYNAMRALAVEDEAVKSVLAKERTAEMFEAFGVVSGPEDDEGWQMKLKCHPKTGQPLATIDNVWLILEHDPLLKDKFALNQFSGRDEVSGTLPWRQEDTRRLWSDSDNAGLYWYLERGYGITGRKNIDDALSLQCQRHAFNDMTAWLEGLDWDGVPRLDTLFIDYLGADDTPYIRAITRKAFTAAVARAMTPGVKYDQMLILSGPQGIGKSTILRKLSKGRFSDSIRTFEGKESSELLQGVWLVEIAELEAFRNSDVNRIKQFVSQQADRFRAAYGRHVAERPRCCVFFGTTNSTAYLQDRTGNRRYWSVDVGQRPPMKSVFRDLDSEVDQLWAEAVTRWKEGEPLDLPVELEGDAREDQEAHREASPREGAIVEFLSRKVPADWQQWDKRQRQLFWSGAVTDPPELTERTRVCALEVWEEALGGRLKDLTTRDAREINDIIAALPGWKRAGRTIRCGPYGPQKGLEKFATG